MSSPTSRPPDLQENVGRSAFLVAAGIFFSRIFGLVRESVFAHYFGLSGVADAFRSAFRIPNILQNLLGEGVISASFIPVYAKLLAQGEEEKEESGRVAGAIFSLLALLTSGLVLVGVLAAPLLTDLIAPGFHDARRALTIQLVRVLFPGIGLLVMSAWCLGVLNSHRKFFLSYISPVVWNVAMIAALLIGGSSVSLESLALYAAWGSVVGSALQFLVQLPTVMRLAPTLRFALAPANEHVRVVIKNFVPVFVSRGVNQISAYLDNFLASFLPVGAVAALSNAQILAMLPVSLFGMAISAAELPGMSSAMGNDEEVAETLRRRIAASTRRIGFFVVPSAVAFLALGDVIAAAIFQSGHFKHTDSLYVWGILAGSAVGLVASTTSRLYSSAYYALRDTRTPLRYAVIRVLLTGVLGYICALPLPRYLGYPTWGAAGLTASAGFAAWLEFTLLRRSMDRRIGRVPFPVGYFAKLWTAAVVSAAVALGFGFFFYSLHPLVKAVVVLGPYCLSYMVMTVMMGIEEAAALRRRVFGFLNK
jgi:putative peptidoglycan lipid II flippase